MKITMDGEVLKKVTINEAMEHIKQVLSLMANNDPQRCYETLAKLFNLARDEFNKD